MDENNWEIKYNELERKYKNLIDILVSCEGAELERELREATGID